MSQLKHHCYNLQQPQECQSSMNSYCLNVTNAEGNEVAVSPCVRSEDGSVHLLVGNLNGSSSYRFTITSNNKIGTQSTTALSFSKDSIMKCQIRLNIIKYKYFW